MLFNRLSARLQKPIHSSKTQNFTVPLFFRKLLVVAVDLCVWAVYFIIYYFLIYDTVVYHLFFAAQ